jgi:hypothetical protein
LKKTRQSFEPPKISPSRIARPQNLKKHLVKEGRDVGEKTRKPATSKDLSLLRACKNQHNGHRSAQTDRQRKNAPARFFPQTKQNKNPPKKFKNLENK